MKEKLVFGLGFVIQSLIYYPIWSCIDNSFEYGLLVRFAAMVSGSLYFYLLIKRYLKKWVPVFVFAMLVHLGICVWATEQINQKLLESNHASTWATVMDCKKRSGTEYCNYCYVLNGRTYKHSILNKAPQYKYKNNGRIRIIYYINNPVVSKPE